MNRMHRVVVVHALIIACSFSLNAETIIRGNVSGETPESTFSFVTRAWATSRNGDLVVLGGRADEAKEYSLSVLEAFDPSCAALATEKALNGNSESCNNPLYAQDIRSIFVAEKFASRGTCLFVTTQARPDAIYLVDNANSRNNQRRIYQSPDIPDASNTKVNGGIVGVAPAAVLSINRGNQRGLAGGAFIAVRGNGQASFGDGDSGITVAFLAETRTKEMHPVKEPEKTAEEKKQEAKKKAAEKRAGLPEKKIEPKLEERIITRWGIELLALNEEKKIVAPLNKDSDAVKIGSALAHIGDVVALYWHEQVNRLYIGLQTRAGNGELDGSCALLIGSFTKDSMVISPVISADVITRGACNEIVGAIGSSSQVAVHDIKSMRTSMLLDYLIIVGGNGTQDITQRSVYALPILAEPKKTIEIGAGKKNTASVIDTDLIGHLAAKNSTSHDAIQKVDMGQLPYFSFDKAPQTAQELVRADDAQARVGDGPVPYGTIVQTMVYEDAVIVVVRSDDKTLPSGVFVSHPIFKQDKQIAGWTRWRAIATTYEPILGASVHMDSGAATFIIDAPQATQVKRASWSDGARNGFKAMVSQINKEFPIEAAGVHGLRTLVHDAHCCGVLGITGLRKMMLISQETPTNIFEPGQLEAQIITGGAIEQLGAIVAAAVYKDGAEARLVAAGVEGLAISSALSQNYLLPAGDELGQQFTRFGDYRLVKKIVCDNGYLYVLTDHVLDRIDVRASSLERNELVRVRLADVHQFANSNEYTCLNDLIISDNVALLATTQGLFSNARSIADAGLRSAADVDWKKEDLECDVENVASLFAVSQSGREEDVARGCGGQLYVINGFVGNNRARLNRLYVKPAQTAEDLQHPMVKLPDSTKGRRYNAYKEFYSYRDIYMTDGILQLSARYTDYAEKLCVKNRFYKAEVRMPIPNIETGKKIVALCREPLTGCLLVAGDFGVRVLE